MPIRILHVVAKMNRAGTETMLMNLYKQIDRDEVQFDFAVCTGEHCDYEDEITALGGKLHRYPAYKGINHFAYKKWWDEFFDTHKEYRIVHGHIGSTAAIYLAIAKKHGCYAIAHSHGTREPLSVRAILYNMYSYRTRFIADHFFGCSMAALEARFGDKVAHSKKAEVFNNAIETNAYVYNENVRKEVRDELGLKEGLLTIGTIGRLSPQKNPRMVIEILTLLREKNIDFRFLWVGTGEMKDEIERETRSRNLENQVMMLGVRNDVPRILQAMDVFIFPSIWEGLGIVAIEAQAAGLPTLCSDQVPKEAAVTDLFESIALDNVGAWVNRISANKDKQREVTTTQIVKSGYDIKTTAKYLQKYYVLHSRY